MSNEGKKLKNGYTIQFADGCFDNFDGTQEELDSLMSEIIAQFESGDFIENSQEVDVERLAQEDPELFTKLVDSVDEVPKTRH